jgi:hypothetical protein
MLATSIKPKNNTIFIKQDQTAKDIAVAIVKSIKDSKDDALKIAPYLKGQTKVKSLKNIFIFCKHNIKYNKESSDLQTARSLGRILSMKEGDCKHFTTTIASLCNAMNIPVKLRLISQNYFSADPTHIYCVSTINGKDYIIDPVLNEFNQQATFTKKYDINLKTI